MSKRAAAASLVLAAWVCGLGLLAWRQITRGPEERIEGAALRVAPGSAYYGVLQDTTQIGFASSTVDTSGRGFQINDLFVADLPVGGALHRASARSRVFLNRRLALDSFVVQVQTEAGPIAVVGHQQGDSILTYAVASGSARPDTQRVRLTAPVLFPTMIPMVVALENRPKVGREYHVTLFDPTALGTRDVRLLVRAESLFTIADSAERDPGTHAWRTVHADTVRAWEISGDAPGGFVGWVDAQGRLVQLAQPGNLSMRRGPYEVVYDNWRQQSRLRPAVHADRDILESTAIAANVPIGRRSLSRLRVRLRDVSLAGFDLAGGRQQLAGDTLTVSEEGAAALAAGWTLPIPDSLRRRLAAELAPAPLLQSDDPRIRDQARRLVAGATDPRVAAQRLEQWVYDSLRKDITVGVPNALQVLQNRSGDCNEHTQLYVALARAAGLPARVAAGLVYARGKFYYHAWPEVWLNGWVAVDPTFGQFPADAGHLRFVTGGLDRQAELLRTIGVLRIDVLGVG